MRKAIYFTIKGAPVAKGRPRFRNTGKFISTYTPKKTLNAERDIRKCFEEQHPTLGLPLKGPIALTVRFYMPIPASLSKKKQDELKMKEHVKKPDLDNLVKTVCDALNGYVWHDDSEIAWILTTKTYPDEVGKERTVVRIEYSGE